MAYYLERQERFSEGIQRIGLEQNKMAIDGLANDEDPHGGVHKARKHFKKLRALYRLIRDEAGAEVYRHGNTFYRDLGRRLASLRDITSLIEAVALLQKKTGTMAENEACCLLLALLEGERQAILQGHTEEDSLLEQAIFQLRENRQSFLQLPLRDDCLPEIIAALRRVYQRGYKEYHKALGTPSVEDMHEWRKRVKYLWYQYRLLKQASPRVFRAYKKVANALSDILGDYHDLALLNEKMEEQAGQLPEETRQLLHELIGAHLGRLLDESRRLGAIFYAETPEAFTRRMRSTLKGNLF
ncbi:MAG: CHAD domain-containing protein [Lewinellaceae bacterium]|nr:CHAD domain-containing protein [Phaeodactylibacter sp.]MCB9345994.1 CHAD domain-containing protein [Lewinellaceae bacterium]